MYEPIVAVTADNGFIAGIVGPEGIFEIHPLGDAKHKVFLLESAASGLAAHHAALATRRNGDLSGIPSLRKI